MIRLISDDQFKIFSETSPDYEPLSPTLSSPGPSISERGGQNSPPRFQKVAKVSPTVYKKFNTRSSTAAAASMTAVSPKLVQAVPPTNVKAVVGMKRGNYTTGGPKPKEVKMYRVQPSQNFTGTNVTNNNNNRKLSVATATTKSQANLANGMRKILINAIDVKDLRTIKIINANTLKNPHLKIAAANLLQQSKQGLLPKNALLSKDQYELGVKEELSDDLVSDDFIMKNEYEEEEEVDEDDEDDDDEDDFDRYGGGRQGAGGSDKLLLTAEEKRLLAKEGISLPQNYPLTKHEERELKRIRRKIRNKISAQDSRKRKKEYVDGLEERVKQCTDENQSLMKRIKMLQNQNQSLMTQMKKLQNLLSKNSGTGSSTAQPATCLMVLLLSMALIAAPNLKLGKRDAAGKEAELAEAIQETMQQNRRNLLFDTVNTNEEVDFESMICNENDFVVENENVIENFYHRIGVGDKQAASMPKGKMKANVGTFVDLDLDDTIWRAGQMKQNLVSEANAGGKDLLGLGSTMSTTGMDNFLIMELRNNLMQNQAEEEAAPGDEKKINNSLRVVHATRANLNSNILFQD